MFLLKIVYIIVAEVYHVMIGEFYTTIEIHCNKMHIYKIVFQSDSDIVNIRMIKALSCNI